LKVGNVIGTTDKGLYIVEIYPIRFVKSAAFAATEKFTSLEV